MGYKHKTYASGDPLRKFSHGARFDSALSLCNLKPNARVLDFGGGDGAFLERVQTQADYQVDALLFEPKMDVPKSDAFAIARVWAEVESNIDNGPFDIVFCQEVMEHFSPSRQDEELARISSVMASAGTLLLSVPVELGPVALIKNIARWKYRDGGSEIYTYANLVRSLFARPIPVARTGDSFLTHMGFYYTDFREVLARHFVIDRVVGSPFRKLPLALNSQVFFCCHRRVDSV